MKKQELNCPNCSGSLELDIDHLISFCPYCGAKLLFDAELVKTILLERERTKQEQEKTEQERMRHQGLLTHFYETIDRIEEKRDDRAREQGYKSYTHKVIKENVIPLFVGLGIFLALVFVLCLLAELKS